MRQPHVKEELIRTGSSGEKRSPVYKTFADAKQITPVLDDFSITTPTSKTSNIISTQAVISRMPVTYMDLNYIDTSLKSSESYLIKNEYDVQPTTQLISQNYDDKTVNYDDYTGFYQQARGRVGRRKSRELPEPPAKTMPSASHPLETIDNIEKRKPETMRSISEDTGNVKTDLSKPTTRRSLSHPEKEVPQKCEKVETTLQITPSKLTFAEILAAKKKSQSYRRKNTSNSELLPRKFQFGFFITNFFLY